MTFINPYSFIDALVFQHQRILTLFDRVLATEAEDRDEAFFELRRLLAVHEAAEEVVVHPRARREIDSGESVVADRLEEEDSAKRTLTELEQMDIQSPDFVAKTEALRAAVERHAEREEREEFIALRNGLDDQEAARMASAVEVIESIAPTRPHPGVNTATENLIIGPFAAMLDRARDTIAAGVRAGAD